ncbi:hypothetical protein HYU92_05160 [Candidatus Curtissbacteria bacterium]|nr:hypothetical protein [Candidatus Curtissbacteria bacterium]
MIKLVVFDWNGTLFADAIACFEADNHVLQSLGIKPITLKIFRQKFEVPVVKFYASMGLNKDQLLNGAKINFRGLKALGIRLSGSKVCFLFNSSEA